MTETPRTSATVPRSTRELVAWRNAIFAIFFLSGLAMASWVARIPAIRDDTGLTTQGVGLVILASSIGAVAGLVAAPWLLARLGARLGMISALVTVSVGLVFTGVGGSDLLPSVPLVVIGLALFGFGNGTVDVMMNVEGAEAEREIGRTVMPMMHAFFSFGTVAGAGVAAAASSLDIPVSWHLGVMALGIAAGIFVAVRYVPVRAEVGDDTHTGPRPPWTERLKANLAVWADVRLLLIGVIMLGMSFAEGSANDWLALAVVDGHGFDATTGALMFGVFTVSITAGRVVGGPILDRFGRVPVLRTLAVVGIAGLSLFIFGTETWMLVVGTVLWGIGSSLGFPVGMSAAADHPTDSAARVSAVAIIGYCAFLAGPPLLGFIGQHFGILNALLVILVLLVLSFLAAPAARENARTAAS